MFANMLTMNLLVTIRLTSESMFDVDSMSEPAPTIPFPSGLRYLTFLN